MRQPARPRMATRLPCERRKGSVSSRSLGQKSIQPAPSPSILLWRKRAALPRRGIMGAARGLIASPPELA